MSSSTDDRRRPPPAACPRATWSEEDEVRLLEIVLELAQERPEDFDPSLSLFVRIRRRIGGAFENEEVLQKVKDLRRTYESGGLDWAEGTSNPGGLRIRQLCARIWGDTVVEVPPPPPSPPPPSPPPPSPPPPPPPTGMSLMALFENEEGKDLDSLYEDESEEQDEKDSMMRDGELCLINRCDYSILSSDTEIEHLSYDEMENVSGWSEGKGVAFDTNMSNSSSRYVSSVDGVHGKEFDQSVPPVSNMF